jgi:hypothetical protein
MKTLVLYAIYEMKNCVKYFIKNGIFKDENVDFLFISMNSELSFPENIQHIFCENKGRDFGAWSHGLLINERYKNYDKFIFLNDTIVGPFSEDKWTDVFLSGLNDNVKLIGSTINTCAIDAKGDPRTRTHVQSYAFCMKRETLDFLIEKGIFSLTKFAENRMDAIVNYEIQMSRYIIENGWNIGSLMKYYEGVDFRFKTKNPEDYNITWLDDMMYPQLIGMVSSPKEVMFIKENRFNINYV